MNQECPEWQSALLFWWRIATTIGVAILGGMLYQNRQKLGELANKNNELKRRAAVSDPLGTSNESIHGANRNGDNTRILGNALQEQSDAGLRQRKLKLGEVAPGKSTRLRTILHEDSYV